MPMANDLQHMPYCGIGDSDCLEYNMDNLLESNKYTAGVILRRLLFLKIIIITTSQFLVDSMQNNNLTMT